MKSAPVPGKTIRIALLEDATQGARPLLDVLRHAPNIEVAGSAAHDHALLALVRAASPDVLVVRITRSVPDALDVVRRVMGEQPLPIVVCATGAEALRPRALAAGAVSCVETPPDHAGAARDAAADELLQAVRLMAEVKVVRRWARSAAAAKPLPAREGLGASSQGISVVGIGTSTGGPAVLRTILCGLPADFPWPLLVVQHIASGFVQGMADWLAQSCRLPVQVARYGDQPLPGHVYLAPDGLQMGVAEDGRIILAREPSDTALCPSASFLFQSLAGVYGPRAVGVLLTGMGKDGAAGLKMMKDRGAITIAQDRESSVVHGMAG